MDYQYFPSEWKKRQLKAKAEARPNVYKEYFAGICFFVLAYVSVCLYLLITQSV